ncbi:MAG: hypothetical protein AAFQ64_05100 [Pseudomonadota bacterium]
MQTIAKSYKSMSVLVNLNLDRLVTTATVIGSLYFATYLFLG